MLILKFLKYRRMYNELQELNNQLIDQIYEMRRGINNRNSYRIGIHVLYQWFNGKRYKIEKAKIIDKSNNYIELQWETKSGKFHNEWVHTECSNILDTL
jgi:hypothetical protein